MSSVEIRSIHFFRVRFKLNKKVARGYLTELTKFWRGNQRARADPPPVSPSARGTVHSQLQNFPQDISNRDADEKCDGEDAIIEDFLRIPALDGDNRDEVADAV